MKSEFLVPSNEPMYDSVCLLGHLQGYLMHFVIE